MIKDIEFAALCLANEDQRLSRKRFFRTLL